MKVAAVDEPLLIGGKPVTDARRIEVRNPARIEAGQVWVNSRGIHASNHLPPYGGVKPGGIGRKPRLEGIPECAQSQTIATCERG